MPEAGRPLRPRRSRRLRRRVFAAAALAAAALWFFPAPVSTETLLRALPPGAVAAASVRGLAAEEKALLSNPVFEEAVRAFGADPEDVRENNAGVFATLYWLTGRRSALALVPAEGECGGLGWYLAGASAVGWKTRALELLWRLKRVPFLGPLETREDGTRFMRFKGRGFVPENGIVLGLDIERGVLVAVLAQDPGRVRELARRVRRGTDSDSAPCLRAGSSPDWASSTMRHRLWVEATPEAGGGRGSAPRAVLDVGRFGGPGLDVRASVSGAGGLSAPRLRAGAAAPSLAPALGAPLAGTFLFAAGDVSPLAPVLSGLFPVGVGFGAAWASAAPYAGRVSIVEAPSFRAVLPLDPEQAAGGGWPARAKAVIDGAAAALKPRWRDARDGSTLLHFKNLKTNLFGETPDDDCAWMRAGGGFLALGTHYGSAKAQEADAAALREKDPAARTLGSVFSGMAAEEPDSAAVAFADFEALAATARQTGALLALAKRFGLRLDREEDAAADRTLAVLAAAGGLGEARLWLVPAPDGGWSARFRADGLKRRPADGQASGR